MRARCPSRPWGECRSRPSVICPTSSHSCRTASTGSRSTSREWRRSEAIPVIEAKELAVLLPDFLVLQRWYGASDRELSGVEISEFEIWREEWPALVWMVADASFTDGSSARFQIPVGLRPLDQTERFLEG